MKSLIPFLCVIAILTACAVQTPTTPPENPVCDRQEFANSWICAQLKTHGFQYAETANDLILDANDLSLIFDVYTVEQLSDTLDDMDRYLDEQYISYTAFFDAVLDDVTKAKRVVSILQRRFSILRSAKFILTSDRELLRKSIQSIRDAAGIE